MKAFEQVYGRPPAGVWAAPGRVNLIGEHTDYNDGFVLPVALPQTTRAAVAMRDDGVLRLSSAGFDESFEGAIAGLEPDAVSGWAAYVAGVAWAFREAGLTVPGMDVLLDSDVPIGAGLSSSAALECAIAVALDELTDAGLALPELARLAQRAENDFAGVPSGVLDQSASLRCTVGHAMFLDVRSGEVEQVPFDVRRHGRALLVIDTRAQHQLADGQYAARRTSCEEAAAQLGLASLRDATLADVDRLDGERRRRARHVVTENRRVLDVVGLLRDDRLPEVGPLLTASHASLRDDYEVSCAELDTAVDTALTAGALGARMTGGGFGGSAIALVGEDEAEAVEAAVRTAFAAAGFAEPQVFEVVAGPGAHRVH